MEQPRDDIEKNLAFDFYVDLNICPEQNSELYDVPCSNRVTLSPLNQVDFIRIVVL